MVGIRKTRSWWRCATRRSSGARSTESAGSRVHVPDDVRRPDAHAGPRFVKLMTHEFIARWQPEWDGRLGELNMTRHQIVTLASIIEAEVRYSPDRPYVSAVYHNRLRRGCTPGGSDRRLRDGRRLRRVWENSCNPVTVQHVLESRTAARPINQPVTESDRALYPAHTGYLYSSPNRWKHIFSARTPIICAIKRVRQRHRPRSDLRSAAPARPMTATRRTQRMTDDAFAALMPIPMTGIAGRAPGQRANPRPSGAPASRLVGVAKQARRSSNRFGRLRSLASSGVRRRCEQKAGGRCRRKARAGRRPNPGARPRQRGERDVGRSLTSTGTGRRQPARGSTPELLGSHLSSGPDHRRPPWRRRGRQRRHPPL